MSTPAPVVIRRPIRRSLSPSLVQHRCPHCTRIMFETERALVQVVLKWCRFCRNMIRFGDLPTPKT